MSVFDAAVLTAVVDVDDEEEDEDDEDEDAAAAEIVMVVEAPVVLFPAASTQ